MSKLTTEQRRRVIDILRQMDNDDDMGYDEVVDGIQEIILSEAALSTGGKPAPEELEELEKSFLSVNKDDFNSRKCKLTTGAMFKFCSGTGEYSFLGRSPEPLPQPAAPIPAAVSKEVPWPTYEEIEEEIFARFTKGKEFETCRDAFHWGVKWLRLELKERLASLPSEEPKEKESATIQIPRKKYIEIVRALVDLVELGRKNHENPKYDEYYAGARAALLDLPPLPSQPKQG